MIENRLSLNAREALQRGRDIERQQLEDAPSRDAPILRSVSARDLRIVMDVALFQLAKKPQPYAERIYRLDGGDFVKLSSGSAGMATAWDYDIVLKATGYLVRLMDQSEPDQILGGRTIVIPRSELLMGDGQNQYDRLYGRLERLRTTTVEIRRRTGKNVVETSVEGLISGFRIIETDARVTVVELSLPMWLHSEVVGSQTPNVLRINPAYFSIRSSLARYIYRVARFAAQDGARYRFETLYLRSGSTEGKSQFSARLRELIKAGSIPDFNLREIRGESGPLLLINPRR